MKPLEDSKLIVESEVGESTGGRKPILYDINSHGFYVLGIDISRTYTQIVIVDLKMNLIDKYRFQMNEFFSPEETINTISSITHDAMKSLSIDMNMLLGIGVGTVGPLDRDKGIMANPKNFMSSQWINVPIRKMLSNKFNTPVIVDNGANTAALGEFLFGEGKGLKNIAYINCGIGIRTGAISSGNIVRAINDAEDTFGHMIIDMDGDLCSCGNYGCVECYSSINSITSKFVSQIKKGRFSKITKLLGKIEYIDICIAAEENDELAREVIMSGAAAFGAGLANYINLLSPQLVVLSGPLIKHSNLFYQVSTDVALKKYYHKGESKIVFSKGGYFKDNAISMGAAATLVEELLK
jgi:predicted NBD/HSP70 family sugar kinase